MIILVKMYKFIKKILFRILFNEYERVAIVWVLKTDSEHNKKLSLNTSDFEQSVRYKEDSAKSDMLRNKIYEILPIEDRRWIS